MLPHAYPSVPDWQPPATRCGDLIDDFCREHGLAKNDVLVFVARWDDARRADWVEAVERMGGRVEL